MNKKKDQFMLVLFCLRFSFSFYIIKLVIVMRLYVDEDIYLRDIVDNEEEYKRLYNWCLNPSVYKYFEQRILSYDEVVSKYKRRVGNEEVKTLIILYKAREIGLVQYEKMDEEDRERFGILLDDVVSIDIFIGDSSFYGLGIGTRVVKYISKYLLSKFDMVIANVQSTNDSSINMCLKSGFKKLREVDYFDTLGKSTKNTLLYLK